ncbi:hypothetical protein ABW19_dt0204852 [Dactylella cylindrospora]|nr:hypothetical protein ABW19_dt0204852 [Dactylella cylindrospora]
MPQLWSHGALTFWKGGTPGAHGVFSGCHYVCHDNIISGKLRRREKVEKKEVVEPPKLAWPMANVEGKTQPTLFFSNRVRIGSMAKIHWPRIVVKIRLGRGIGRNVEKNI